MIDDSCCSIGLKLAVSCDEVYTERMVDRCGCVRSTGIGNGDCDPNIFPLDDDSVDNPSLPVFNNGEGP